MLKILKDFFFKPRLGFLAPKADEVEKIYWFQIALRLWIAVVTAAWIGFFPFYLFIIYMHYNKFFSYDFFVEGVFGLNIFIVASVILILFIAVYFYGFILLTKLGIIDQNKQGKNRFRLLTWISILVSSFTHYTFMRMSFDANRPKMMLWLMAISIVICLFLYSFIGHGLQRNLRNWVSPLFFIAATVSLPLLNRDVTSEVVSIGLRNFNMGGGLNIEVLITGSDKERKIAIGKLTLLTPRNLYFKTNDNKLNIFPMSEKTRVKIW